MISTCPRELSPARKKRTGRHRRPGIFVTRTNAALLTIAVSLLATSVHGQTTPDVDLDGVPDDQDNCIVLGASPIQIDSDQDGFGDVCDPDYDQDGLVLGTDIAFMFGSWGSPGVTDHTLDGITLADDYVYLLSRVNQYPYAISGLSCADPTIQVPVDPPCLP